MGEVFVYFYLHGFGSGPNALKARTMREYFFSKSLTLHCLDLNQPNFQEMPISNAIAHIDTLYQNICQNGQKLCLIGSSLGGLMAIRYAELNPEKVDRLILLCPAFDIIKLCAKRLYSTEIIQNWKESGILHFKLLEDGDGPKTQTSTNEPINVD